MRCFVITKRRLLTILAVTTAVILAAVGSASVFAASGRSLPIYNVQTEEKVVALSFDAAWGADDTDTLISILGDYGAKATFFVVGEWVDKYPDEVQKLADAGMSVQNHSDTHPHFTQISTTEMTAQLSTCNGKIEAITGVKPILFRPPYGDYNNSVIDTVNAAGMYPIQWDVDSLDWQDSATVESITSHVLNKVQNGSILLFHNDADHTPEALPGILQSLKDMGYSFVLIQDLIYRENYTIDHAGKQIPNTDGTASQ